MTQSDNPQASYQGLKTNPALERLGILAGEWNVEMSSMSFHLRAWSPPKSC